MQELKEASSQDQLKRNRWEETTLQKSLGRQPERTSKFQTVSLADIARLYDPTDVADVNFDGDISFPGEFPYTRGIHATDRKSTRLNSSHVEISYAVFCLKKKTINILPQSPVNSAQRYTTQRVAASLYSHTAAD